MKINEILEKFKNGRTDDFINNLYLEGIDLAQAIIKDQEEDEAKAKAKAKAKAEYQSQFQPQKQAQPQEQDQAQAQDQTQEQAQTQEQDQPQEQDQSQTQEQTQDQAKASDDLNVDSFAKGFVKGYIQGYIISAIESKEDARFQIEMIETAVALFKEKVSFATTLKATKLGMKLLEAIRTLFMYKNNAKTKKQLKDFMILSARDLFKEDVAFESVLKLTRLEAEELESIRKEVEANP
jgi:hypothetical protein